MYFYFRDSDSEGLIIDVTNSFELDDTIGGLSITINNSFENISDNEISTNLCSETNVSTKIVTKTDTNFTSNPNKIEGESKINNSNHTDTNFTSNPNKIEGESKINNSNHTSTIEDEKTFVGSSTPKSECKSDHLIDQNNNFDTLSLTENKLEAIDISQIPMPKRKKAKQCRFYKLGFCKKGDNCDFSHGKSEIKVIKNVSMEFPTYEDLYKQNQALIEDNFNLRQQMKNEREMLEKQVNNERLMKESLKEHLFSKCKFQERIGSGTERASATLMNEVGRAPSVLDGSRASTSMLENCVEKKRKIVLESQVTYGPITKKGRVFTEEEYRQHLVKTDIKRRDAKIKRQRKRIAKEEN